MNPSNSFEDIDNPNNKNEELYELPTAPTYPTQETWDGSESWETSIKPSGPNIFLEDFNHFEGDTERVTAHTQAMLSFTTKLLGKYIVVQRTISLIFT